MDERYLPGYRLLDDAATAEALGLKSRTLPNWRVLGKGPKHVKIGGKVFYLEKDIIAFLEAQRRASTSDPGGLAD